MNDGGVGMRVKRAGLGWAGGRVEEILESVFMNTVHIGVVVNDEIFEA